MEDLDRKAKELIEEMKKEAVQRLKTIKPNDLFLVDKFSKNGTIYVQDISIYADEKDRLRRANKEEMDVVHEMEDGQGNLPYFMIKYTGGYEVAYATIYYFLYVSYDKRNWSLERSSLQKYGRPYMEPYVFKVNAGIRPQDDESPINTLFSRFTRIKISL